MSEKRNTKSGKIINVSSESANLKRKLRRHFSELGFKTIDDGLEFSPDSGKDGIRLIHRAQRIERLEANNNFIREKREKLQRYFASGKEVDPYRVEPVLEKVKFGTLASDLFRFSSLTWSVPVSNGFGRRIRYLVWDANTNKLMGLIALGDPVYNLRARDDFIDWGVEDRKERLVNVMDAYVLGALPPYNQLLGGKLIASLIKSRDVYEDFSCKYGETVGVISKKRKSARLLAVTTSSSLGRSSVYNRLKINGEKYFQSLGYTTGWGHFHIPDDLFKDLRSYIAKSEHKYANGYGFGEGPNWRLRVTKEALTSLGMNPKCLRHGIKREVFISLLAKNSIDLLNGDASAPDISSLKSVKEIGESARDRWLIGRAERRPEFKKWRAEQVLDLLKEEKEVDRDKYTWG